MKQTLSIREVLTVWCFHEGRSKLVTNSFLSCNINSLVFSTHFCDIKKKGKRFPTILRDTYCNHSNDIYLKLLKQLMQNVKSVL